MVAWTLVHIRLVYPWRESLLVSLRYNTSLASGAFEIESMPIFETKLDDFGGKCHIIGTGKISKVARRVVYGQKLENY